jgi:hypothetical protein
MLQRKFFALARRENSFRDLGLELSEAIVEVGDWGRRIVFGIEQEVVDDGHCKTSYQANAFQS